MGTGELSVRLTWPVMLLLVACVPRATMCVSCGRDPPPYYVARCMLRLPGMLELIAAAPVCLPAGWLLWRTLWGGWTTSELHPWSSLAAAGQQEWVRWWQRQPPPIWRACLPRTTGQQLRWRGRIMRSHERECKRNPVVLWPMHTASGPQQARFVGSHTISPCLSPKHLLYKQHTAQCWKRNAG